MLLSSKEIYRGRVVRLSLERVRLPNGHETELEILHHPGGAAAVAIDDLGRIALLHQFRHAAGGYVWELPAGKLEPREPPIETARRELMEEAGVRAADWHELGSYVSSPGVFTERIYLYLARGLTRFERLPEDGEVFELHWLPLAEAVDRVMSGIIDDGKTMLGILKAQRWLQGEKASSGRAFGKPR